MLTARALASFILIVTLALTARMPAQVATAKNSRATALGAAFPEVQKIFASFAERAHLPGAAFGVIVDKELVFSAGIGVRDVATKAPVDADTMFRIASMSKSFTAAAILKLRDEGRLSLDDPAEKYIPELANLTYPTKDSPRVTVRHLLSHSEGFPEDNPWGDRQLAIADQVMSTWMRDGIPFSTAPGTAYEYSNYGFAMLGQIVQRVSGQPYPRFMREQIFGPLGMTDTTFEVTEVPATRIARGYRWAAEGWAAEPLLPHGSFGAMGGLWTSTRDLAKWVSFLLSAFPPRDDEERGPIARRSAREMQQVWRSTRATAISSAIDMPVSLNAGGYGYGLRVSHTCAFGHLVAHGGGLPGYGSLMQWLPEYGVGLIAMGNVTYAGWGGAFNNAWTALAKTGALTRRDLIPSKALVETQASVNQLMQQWDDRAASSIAADNLFLDQSAASRKTELEALRARHGTCQPKGSLSAENALRGTWRLACERGWMDVSITLAPTSPPSVQFWGIRSVLPPSEAMSASAARVASLIGAWSDDTARRLGSSDLDQERLKRQIEIVRAERGACRVGEATDGDGTTRTTVRLDCDRGSVMASLTADPATGSVSQINLAAVPDGACTP